MEGRNAQDVRDEMVGKYEVFAQNKLDKDLADIKERKEILIKNIRNEKGYKKAENKAEYSKIRISNIEFSTEKKKEKVEDKHRLVKGNITRNMEFFTIGRVINYPVTNFDGDTENVPGVCLGVVVDEKRENPYAPSAMKVKFALASSLKFLAITMGPKFMQKLSEIQGVSYTIRDWNARTTIETWDDIIGKSTKNRSTRYMVTGNLLQAYSDYSGNLVSFTTDNGSTKKGILMPENFQPKEGGETINVPIVKATRFIKSLTIGGMLTISGGMSLLKQYGMFKIFVPGSKAKGGKFFMDQEILKLVKDGNFEKQSNTMVAEMDEYRIDELINILQESHSLSVELTTEQYLEIADTLEKPKPKEVMEMPKKKDDEDEELLLLELEAEALELELLKAA